MKRKLLSIFMCLAMVLTLVPVSVLAEENGVSYIDRAWDGEEIVEIERQVTRYQLVTSSTTTMSAGTFYVVSGDVTVSGRIVIEGTSDEPTSIILTDGCTFNAERGIQLHSGKALNIYGQANDTGKLNAASMINMPTGCSAIGGNASCSGGSLTVYGGNIYAQGGYNASGIGGGRVGNGGKFTMYGGIVEAWGVYGIGIGNKATGSHGAFNVYGDVAILSGDSAPNEETTVADYNSSRKKHVKITQNKEHIWKAVNPSAPVYCTKSANCDIECSVCHETKSVVLRAANTHSWQQNGITPATCTLSSAYNRECTACHTKKDFPIGEPKGHSWETTLVTPATCTARAVYKNDCSVCHDFYTFEEGDMLRHNFVNGYCTDCGLEQPAFEYIVRSWDDNKIVESKKTLKEYEFEYVTSTTTTFEDGKYYVAKGDVTVPNRIIANGKTYLILLDDCNFIAEEGIGVSNDSSITIYGQTNDSGVLTANGKGSGTAGIGGEQDGNVDSVIISGGTINASGGMGAGIGGGDDGSVKTIIIYGGMINSTSNNIGAAIGSGFYGTVDTINIYGGIINSNTSGDGNCIGAGGGEEAKCSLINICGGSITATIEKEFFSRSFKSNKIVFDLYTHAEYISANDGVQRELNFFSSNITSALNNSHYAYIYQDELDLEPVTYIERDEISSTYKTITDYEVVSPFTTKFENNKYYVVVQSVDTDNRITVSGTAHLILLDGKTLNAKCGIGVDEGNKLFIYGQCADRGILKADTNDDINSSYSALGGSKETNAGDIAICGGTIKASATNLWSAGIGGSDGHTHGYIDIYGGTVNASSYYGAGIGAGDSADGNRSKAISIYGGTVNASSTYGAGIGAGWAAIEGTDLLSNKLVAGHGGLVKFYGGNVTAQSEGASAIGATNKTVTYVSGSTKTFYGNPGILYMEPSITLYYGNDKNTATSTVTTTSLSQNVGANVDRQHYVTYTMGASETHVYAPATCTEPKTCMACGATDGKPLGHEFTEQGELISAADCTHAAVYAAKCVRCEETGGTIELGSPLGHNYDAKYKVKDATETTPAEYHAVCTRCEDVIDDYIPKTALDSSSLNNIAVGDILKNGAVFKNDYKMVIYTYDCNIFVNGEAVDKIAYNGEWTATECLRCTKVLKFLVNQVYFESCCDYTEANCKEPATCVYCGHTEGEIGDHIWIDATVYAPKTCFVCGLTEGEPVGGWDKVIVTSGENEGELDILSLTDRRVVVLESEYDNNKLIIQTKIKKLKLASNEACKYKVDLDKYTKGNSVKVLVWNNLSDIKPLCKSVEFEVK